MEMVYKVIADEKEFTVPAAIGQSTDTLRKGLVGTYPWIDTAKFTVEVKDGVTTYTVIKKAGTLG